MNCAEWLHSYVMRDYHPTLMSRFLKVFWNQKFLEQDIQKLGINHLCLGAIRNEQIGFSGRGRLLLNKLREKDWTKIYESTELENLVNKLLIIDLTNEKIMSDKEADRIMLDDEDISVRYITDVMDDIVDMVGTFHTIILSDNKLKNDGLKTLVEYIKKMYEMDNKYKLKKLDIRNNEITNFEYLKEIPYELEIIL